MTTEKFWNSWYGRVVVIGLSVAVLTQIIGALGYILLGWR